MRELSGGGEEMLDVCGPGAYFGELGPFLGFPRAATARARTDAVVVGHTVAAFKSRIEDAGLAELVSRSAGSQASP